MFCLNCGWQRREGVKFCPRCGTRFAAAEPTPERKPTRVLQPATTPDETSIQQSPPAPAGLDPTVAVPSAPRPGPERATGRRRGAMVTIVVVALLLVGGAATGTVLLTHGSGASSAAGAHQTAAKQHGSGHRGTASAQPVSSATPAPTLSPSPTAQSFAQVYQDDSSGVVRIATTACDGGGIGSGFLVAPNMVATVAHVVSGAVSIAVRDGATTTTGTLVGFDADHEVALIQTSSDLPGHVFTLGAVEPQVGTDIAAIGYPLGGAESLSEGAISGLGRNITVEGHQLHDLVQTDASINPGNSGGPLLTSDGTVVGLVEAKRTDAENIGYAIPAASAAPELQSWQAAPQQVTWPTGCDFPTGPNGTRVDITDRSASPHGPAIARAFSTYVNSINTGDYITAYGILSPAEQQKVSYNSFSSGNVSSYITELSVDSITTGPTGDTVHVRFTSMQEPRYGYHGQACSDWSMTYAMVPSGGAWLIDKATPAQGSPTAC